MSRASKDRKAKEKRRRGYQSALERKVSFLNEYTRLLKNDHKQMMAERQEARKNEAIAKLALKDALGRALIIKHLDDAFDIAVLVEHTTEGMFYPGDDRFNPVHRHRGLIPANHPDQFPPKTAYIPGSRNKVVRKIDKRLLEFSREQDAYLRHMTRMIGEEIAELIMDQLLRDCLKAKEQCNG
jgi:hypothetical protein